MMRNLKFILLVIALLVGAIGVFAPAFAGSEYPKPSPYPTSWEIKFQHGLPKRIVVTVPGNDTPQPYWYMTYAVTNTSDKEQMFLPIFEWVTKEGKVIRSDNNIPAVVFDTIKTREKNKFLEPSYKIAGELRVGDDQAREGVAIWPEPEARLGSFWIFVGGLSGEIAQLKDDSGAIVKDKDGQPVILRKTLQLNYLVRGDEVYPGEDEVNSKSEDWVMR